MNEVSLQENPAEITTHNAVDLIVQRAPRLLDHYTRDEIAQAVGNLITRLLVVGRMEAGYDRE